VVIVGVTCGFPNCSNDFRPRESGGCRRKPLKYNEFGLMQDGPGRSANDAQTTGGDLTVSPDPAFYSRPAALDAGSQLNYCNPRC
jgi:hypothetical protein